MALFREEETYKIIGMCMEVYNELGFGFSEIIYAVTSASANNGSAFAGISANTKILNLFLGKILEKKEIDCYII